MPDGQLPPLLFNWPFDWPFNEPFDSPFDWPFLRPRSRPHAVGEHQPVMRANPLIAEALHGMARPGRAHMDYLFHLLILAATVFIWWPKHTLTETLQRQNPPDTLLAALLVCGAILAYYAARAGAEELLLTGQHGLRDWVVGTALTLPRILSGYLGAHLLHCAHLLALASPIILLAFHVSGGQWPALSISLAMILWQATFYRLAAASIYIAIGQHGTLTAIGIRAFLVLTYVLSALALPIASQPLLTAGELDGGSSVWALHAGSAPVLFIAFYTALSAGMLPILHGQLARLRDRHSSEAEAP